MRIAIGKHGKQPPLGIVTGHAAIGAALFTDFPVEEIGPQQFGQDQKGRGIGVTVGNGTKDP